jgi:hypothetical protein
MSLIAPVKPPKIRPNIKPPKFEPRTQLKKLSKMLLPLYPIRRPAIIDPNKYATMIKGKKKARIKATVAIIVPMKSALIGFEFFLIDQFLMFSKGNQRK